MAEPIKMQFGMLTAESCGYGEPYTILDEDANAPNGKGYFQGFLLN